MGKPNHIKASDGCHKWPRFKSGVQTAGIKPCLCSLNHLEENMKLKRIVSLPFTMLADAATLGNIGSDRSFTGRVFDDEALEQRTEQELKLLHELANIIRALKS